MTAPRCRENQSSSQSALFPPESLQNAVYAHGHLNRPSAQHGASPTKGARGLTDEVGLQEEDNSSDALIAQILSAGAAEGKAGKAKRRT